MSWSPAETGRRMGHEAIGVVEAVGAEVRTVKRGDVVVMPFAYSDGTCDVLPRGAANLVHPRRVLRHGRRGRWSTGGSVAHPAR